jgi:hypothetical protein
MIFIGAAKPIQIQKICTHIGSQLLETFWFANSSTTFLKRINLRLKIHLYNLILNFDRNKKFLYLNSLKKTFFILQRCIASDHINLMSNDISCKIAACVSGFRGGSCGTFNHHYH